MDSELANPALVDDAGVVVSNPTPPTDTANIFEMCPVMAGGRVADAGDNSYRNDHVWPGCRCGVGCGVVPSPRFSPQFLPPHRWLGHPEHHIETEAEDETSSPSAALPQPGTPVNCLTEPHHLSSREYYCAGVVAGFFLLPSKSPPASLLTQITLPNSALLLETRRPVRAATPQWPNACYHALSFCPLKATPAYPYPYLTPPPPSHSSSTPKMDVENCANSPHHPPAPQPPSSHLDPLSAQRLILC